MPRLLVREGEVVARGECVGVDGAEDGGTGKIRQQRLVHVDGRGNVPRLLVREGEVVARNECAGVVGAEDVCEHVDGVFEGQGRLREPRSIKGYHRIIQNRGEARQVDAGLVGRIVRLSLLLFCNGSELVGHVEGVGPLGVVGVRIVHVDALQQVDNDVLENVEDLGLFVVVFAQDAPLEAVDADIAPVLGRGADGMDRKRPQRLAGNRHSLADPMQPSPGHTRRGKKRQGRQLHGGRPDPGQVLLAAGAVLVGQQVKHRFVGRAQTRIHKRGTIIAVEAVDYFFKPVRVQVCQVLVYRRVAVERYGCGGLAKGDGKVSERLGQTVRALGVVQPGPLDKEIDRLGSCECPDYEDPSHIGVWDRCGCHKDAQTLTLGNQTG